MSGIGTVIWSVACFLLVIGPLIFIHELGHYLVGRWCGVKADAFSIGFGRELLGWTDRRGTRWRLAALPLGGYVKFAGDMSPASRPSPEWLALPPAERARTFQARPVWQRFLIVLAGPAVNFLFAIGVVAAALIAYGEPVTPPVAAQVMAGSPAAQAGVRAGDRIVAIDGTAMRRFEDVRDYVFFRPDTVMRLTVSRDGHDTTIDARALAETLTDRFGNRTRIGLLGIAPGTGQMQPLPLWSVPGRSVAIIGNILRTTAVTIRQFVTGTRSVREMAGPVGVARIAGQQATLGWFAIVSLMAAISINLGFVNLLPVPMLDGGHLVFYVVEAIRRKPVEPEVQEWAFRSGFAVLVGLMLLVTFNDLGSAGLWARLGGLIG